jgi:hypothetical protein
MDYAMPRAGDVPPFAFSTHNVPSTANPLGVKGVPPSIGIIHPHTSMRATPVSEFMSGVQEQLVAIVEQTIAFMCSKHVRPPMAAFPVQIVEWPEENRWQKHVRYSYGLYDANGRPIRSS